MSKITNEHINVAIYESLKSPVHKKFGALLIYRGKIISKGYNYHNNSISNNVRHCLL